MDLKRGYNFRVAEGTQIWLEDAQSDPGKKEILWRFMPGNDIKVNYADGSVVTLEGKGITVVRSISELEANGFFTYYWNNKESYMQVPQYLYIKRSSFEKYLLSGELCPYGNANNDAIWQEIKSSVSPIPLEMATITSKGRTANASASTESTDSSGSDKKRKGLLCLICAGVIAAVTWGLAKGKF